MLPATYLPDQAIPEIAELSLFTAQAKGRQPEVDSMTLYWFNPELWLNKSPSHITDWRAERDSWFIKINNLARCHFVAREAVTNALVIRIMVSKEKEAIIREKEVGDDRPISPKFNACNQLLCKFLMDEGWEPLGTDDEKERG